MDLCVSAIFSQYHHSEGIGHKIPKKGVHSEAVLDKMYESLLLNALKEIEIHTEHCKYVCFLYVLMFQF